MFERGEVDRFGMSLKIFFNFVIEDGVLLEWFFFDNFKVNVKEVLDIVDCEVEEIEFYLKVLFYMILIFLFLSIYMILIF